MSFVKQHKNDLFLVLALLVLAGAAWIYMSLTRAAGAYVSVEINGETVAELPLDENTEMLLGEGEHTNLLVIENGEAYVSEASCPDHICVRQGKISRDGEVIVCLPNKLVVSVRGGEEAATDAVTK